MSLNVLGQSTCDQSANIVLGQSNFTSWGANRTANCYLPECAQSPAANTISLDDGRIVFDSEGRAWVSDKENDRVLRFDPPFRNGMDAAMVLGAANFSSNWRGIEHRSIDASSLYGPLGMAFDSGNDRIRGTRDDRLWVVDKHNNRVLRFDPPYTTGMQASVVLGQPDINSAGENYSAIVGRLEPVANGFDNPADIAIDSSDNLWITDTNNNRVLVYFAPIDESGLIPGATDSADLVLGQPDFRSMSANRGAEDATRYGFYAPRAIAIDSHDNAWVVDNDNNRVLRYDAPVGVSGSNPGGQLDGADVVLGQSSFSASLPYRGENDPILNGLGQPTGIAVDSHDNIWITDGGRRILRYNAPLDLSGPTAGSNDSADLVLGGAAPDEILVDAYTLGRPNGIGVDLVDNVWVVDHDFDRVLRFQCTG